jgi:hypothetical protein
LIVSLLAAPTAQAVEALSTGELMSHCEKYYDEQAREDRVFCMRYIQGFIDGAVATDERVTRNVVGEYDEDETFSERAARTRIGTRLERYGASVYADFCLGDPGAAQGSRRTRRAGCDRPGARGGQSAGA